MNLPPPMTGHELQAFIKTPQQRRKPIVEGLIYERSCVMFASHPGIGKSILTIQMCLEISAGLPVFGAFPSTPTKIYYIQKERPLDEVAERVEEMQKLIPWNPDNFIVDAELQTFNLAKESNHPWIIERIAAHRPGLIVIDPIGAGTPGLSKDEPANIFCNFMTALQKSTGSTNILNHHIVKDSYTAKDGHKIEKEDPFYGSQWLKAHVTGSYLIDKADDGRTFTNKKDSHDNLLSKFDIIYDPETKISSTEHGSLKYHDKIFRYCMALKGTGKTFTLKEVLNLIGCSKNTFLNSICTPQIKPFIKRHKSIGSATLYEVCDPPR